MADTESGDPAANADTGTSGSAQGENEPGFGGAAGDAEGSAALPDMRDTPPVFDAGSGDNTQVADVGSPQGTGAPGGYGTIGSEQDDANGGIAGDGSMIDPSADTPSNAAGGSTGTNQTAMEPGTRAPGGMSTIDGADGTLTAAEQVAILDRQLEQSTSDFDTMILEEQARQRELDRERAARQAQASAEASIPAGSGRSPYQDDIAMGGGDNSVGGGMGGASRGGGGAPDNPAIYKPPADIPEGDNDDVVARQLREAAMREPDPDVRERLWNEYRKYKGLEIPEE